MMKDLMNEKAELENIVAQKSLELDQRDLLMKQNLQIVKARDEIIPLIQSKQKNYEEFTQRLCAVALGHGDITKVCISDSYCRFHQSQAK